MRYKYTAGMLLILTVMMSSGCMTYDSYLKVDELMGEISALQEEAQKKTEEANAGTLTVADALEFTREANKEIARLKDEADKIKKSENVGWAEIIGAAMASMLGATGFVRAWRGPTHKGINVNT